jgi:flagellar export protein FliJ
MSVPFRFDTVLRIRETERDVRQQSFAAEQARESSLRAARDLIVNERTQVQHDLRTLQAGEGWTADQARSLQQHLDLLATRMVEAEQVLQEVAAQVALRRQELLEADIAVKALDKLADRHRATQTRQTLVQEERERDDNPRTGRAA